MRWLLVEMWIYLGVAFVLGMGAYRWVFGSGDALSAEDLAAELASVRTRFEEREAEHRRLKSRLAEVTSQLDESRREARSFEAEAHAARLELEQFKLSASAQARAANRRDVLGVPSLDEQAEGVEPQSEGAQNEGPPDQGASADRVETVSFMAALREGAPDDLTKIKGVGQKLESALNSLGIYYYRQIADWSDADVDHMDTQLKFPGRINRDDWRGQARRLLGRGG